MTFRPYLCTAHYVTCSVVESGGRKCEKYIVPAFQELHSPVRKKSTYTNNCVQLLQNDTEAARKEWCILTVCVGRTLVKKKAGCMRYLR